MERNRYIHSEYWSVPATEQLTVMLHRTLRNSNKPVNYPVTIGEITKEYVNAANEEEIMDLADDAVPPPCTCCNCASVCIDAPFRAMRGPGRATTKQSRMVETDASGGAANPVDRSDAPDLQCLSSPHHKLVEPRLGRPCRFPRPSSRPACRPRILDRLENPVPMLDPQVLQHREGLLAFLDDGAERNHDLRHRRLQFERCGLWVGDVGDDELGQPREQPHGLLKSFVSGLSKLNTMGM